MDAEVVETVSGVVCLLRRAAELAWTQAGADGPRSSHQLLALGIDAAADEASGMLPRRARGVREEPVEERDAYVVGQRQARSAWEPRSRALVAQPTYVAVLVLGPDLQDCQHLVREKVQKGRIANSAENRVVILR